MFPRHAFLMFAISNEKGALGEALESSKILKRCLIYSSGASSKRFIFHKKSIKINPQLIIGILF
ncbi:hypothetical protein CU306_05865 [Prochlorococcus marinus str. MU1414]|nr:hypothetical protein [Prochlorococcus marinus str. MU1414]